MKSGCPVCAQLRAEYARHGEDGVSLEDILLRTAEHEIADHPPRVQPSQAPPARPGAS